MGDLLDDPLRPLRRRRRDVVVHQTEAEAETKPGNGALPAIEHMPGVPAGTGGPGARQLLGLLAEAPPTAPAQSPASTSAAADMRSSEITHSLPLLIHEEHQTA